MESTWIVLKYAKLIMLMYRILIYDQIILLALLKLYKPLLIDRLLLIYAIIKELMICYVQNSLLIIIIQFILFYN